MSVEFCEQFSHSGVHQIFSAEDRNVISLVFRRRCNLFAYSLREVFGFLPGQLQRPDRRSNQLVSRSRNLQVFVENKNIILLQLAEVIKKRRANAGASALRKSCMDDEARFHIGGGKEACAMKSAASKLSRTFEQLNHSFEQTTGAAAVDTAMVEA